MAAASRAVDTVALIIVVAIVAMLLDPHRRTAELIGQVGTAFIDLLRQPPVDILPPYRDEGVVRPAERSAPEEGLGASVGGLRRRVR
jgi:hypothetical protein